MISFALFSQLVGLGAATGVRAGLSLFVFALLARFGIASLPITWMWMQSTPALGALAALTFFEAAAERDDDVQQLMAHAQFGIRALGGAVVGVMMLSARTTVPTEAQYAVAGAFAALIAIGTHGSRMRLHYELLQVQTDVLNPRKWLNRLEEGGVLAVAIAVVLAPFVAVTFVGVAFVSCLAVALAARRLEASWRRPCPACGAAIRVEASLCPRCRAEVPVEKVRELRLLGGVQDAASRLAGAVRAGTGPSALPVGESPEEHEHRKLG